MTQMNHQINHHLEPLATIIQLVNQLINQLISHHEPSPQAPLRLQRHPLKALTGEGFAFLRLNLEALAQMRDPSDHPIDCICSIF